MKSITAFLLLTIYLLADGNRTLPDGLMLDNAENVALNGWNTADDSLKTFLVTDGAKYIKVFLEYAAKPYEVSPEKDLNTLPPQKISLNLSRAEYCYALAYAKYLENQKKTDDALTIYITSLKGLTDALSKDMSTIGLIFTIVIEDLIAQSIKKSLQNNLYNTKQKNRLYTFLKDNLLLNENIFLKVLDKQRTELLLFCLNNNFTNNDDFATLAICGKLDQRIKNFNEKIYQISNEEESRKVYGEFNKDKENFLQNMPNELKEIANNSSNILKKPLMLDTNTISDFFFFISVPKVSATKLDIMSNIENNKKLLKSIKN